MLGLHVYDLLMLALLALLAWQGWRRGLVRELAGLVAFGLGFALAVRLDAPLGRWLRTTLTGLTPTEARLLAFFIILVALGSVIGVAAGLLTGAIRRVPVVGSLNRLGGLAAGAVLALVGIWVLTTCLLLLPATLTPFAKGVRHSETARLVKSVPTSWSTSLSDHFHSLGRITGMR